MGRPGLISVCSKSLDTMSQSQERPSSDGTFGFCLKLDVETSFDLKGMFQHTQIPTIKWNVQRGGVGLVAGVLDGHEGDPGSKPTGETTLSERSINYVFRSETNPDKSIKSGLELG